jgi:hypothetical protein
LSSNRQAPGPCTATVSNGLRRRQRLIDRHPQPMQSSSASRRVLPQLGNALVKTGAPGTGQARPVRAVWRSASRQRLQRRGNFRQRDAYALSDADEHDAAQHIAWILALIAGAAHALDRRSGRVQRRADRRMGRFRSDGECPRFHAGALHTRRLRTAIVHDKPVRSRRPVGIPRVVIARLQDRRVYFRAPHRRRQGSRQRNCKDAARATQKVKWPYPCMSAHRLFP